MIDNKPVELTKEEKDELCLNLAHHLPTIRKLLHLSQADFGERCGFSRNRVILIETGKFLMTWSQYTSILLLCGINQVTKEYIYINGIITPKFLQYMQQIGPLNKPDINISISDDISWSYAEEIKKQIDESAT